MVTDRNKTLYEGAFGRRALDGEVPMTLDTVGLIASMTKALTSVAALQLLEQGKLDLDSPASKWLPALADVQVLDGFASDGSPITRAPGRSEEHTSELQSLMRNSYAVFCLKKKKNTP